MEDKIYIQKKGLLSNNQKRIIKMLGQKELTGWALSSKLGIPLSTVYYSLSILVSSGIVDYRTAQTLKGRPKRIFYLKEKGKKIYRRLVLNEKKEKRADV